MPFVAAIRRATLPAPPLPLRTQLKNLLSDGNTAAWYQPGIGVTSASERASNWANQLGSVPDLAQASGSAQPIVLPWSGTNYLWLPGVAGNHASAPHIAAYDFGAGSFTVEAWLYLTTSGVYRVVTGFPIGSGNFRAFISSGDSLQLFWGSDSQPYAATSGALTLNAWHHSIWGYDATNGKSFVALDGVYTSNVEANHSVSGGTTLFIGSDDGGATYTKEIQIKVVRLFSRAMDASEIAARAAGTLSDNSGLVLNADFTNVAEGASTFTESSSNAATVTINSTGSKPAQIVGSPQLLFDGTAYDMRTGASTRNQPRTMYLVLNQVVHTVGNVLFDDDSLGVAQTMSLRQHTATPKLQPFAGTDTVGLDNSTLAVGAYGIATIVFNGASTTFQINQQTATTGDAGANNADGISLGSDGLLVISKYGNLQIKELIDRSVSDTASKQTAIIRTLGLLHGIAV